MPSLRNVIDWLVTHESFRAAYQQAREIEADILADDVLDIADCETHDNVTAAKVRMDARKWLAAKLKPGKYGEGRRSEPAAATDKKAVVYTVVTGIERAPDQDDTVPAKRKPVRRVKKTDAPS